MRIAHLSDLHFFVPPTLSASLGKRLLGLANLYIKGRIHHFSAEVAKEAIARIRALAPDLVLLTGDVTALASPAEFELARVELAPLLEQFPAVLIPGNHDTYTSGSEKSERMGAYFARWMNTPAQPEGALVATACQKAGLEPPAGQMAFPTLHLQDDVAVLGLNPCRFHLGSAGLLRPEELRRLEVLLQMPEVRARFKVLMLHYPLLNHQGVPTRNYWRRLENREGLLALLERHPVDLVLHGHDHLRYLNHLPRAGGGVTYLYNAGSAAFSRGFDYPIPASFNLYTVLNGALTGVEHFDRTAGGFVPTFSGPPMTRQWSVAATGGYG